MRRTIVGLGLALVGCVSGTTSDTTDTQDTDTTPPTGECEVFDLAMWCHNTENGGPEPAVPDCPTPTIDALLAEPGGYAAPWSGLCDSPSHGPLTVVNQPSGYGGPRWYFDATDTFVAYTYSTDINVYCDGLEFSVSYGFDPDCEVTCVYTDPDAVTGLPPC
jgi:hypothetical protein